MGVVYRCEIKRHRPTPTPFCPECEQKKENAKRFDRAVTAFCKSRANFMFMHPHVQFWLDLIFGGIDAFLNWLYEDPNDRIKTPKKEPPQQTKTEPPKKPYRRHRRRYKKRPPAYRKRRHPPRPKFRR